MIYISILMICIAHIARVLRQELIVNTYEKPNRRNLVKALSVGYIINYFVPFKLGDLVRAYIAGKKMKSGYGFALATVIIDRMLDVVAVGVIFGLISIGVCGGGDQNSEPLAFYTILSAIVITGMLIGWYGRTYVKKISKLFASLFNRSIEFNVLKFCWSLIWGFTDILKRISKRKIAITTIVMWILYCSSYCCFAIFISNQGIPLKWTDIFYILFAKDSMRVGSLGVIYGVEQFFRTQFDWIALYLVLPAILLYAVSFLIKQKESDGSEEEIYLNLLPHMDEVERMNFLETYFSSEQSSYIQNYLKINQNILIIRDYSAGSNATTMLCMDKGINFYRKYAFGSDGDKLYEQIEWIERFKDLIPLPEIIHQEKKEDYCYYDMPYNSNAVGLFEYVHSMPKENAWNVIRQVLECLEQTLYQTNVTKADLNTIDKYIAAKVERNIDKIREARYLKNLMQYEEILINGKRYKNLPYYLKYLSREHLHEVFKNDTYSSIHGDLTIENIISIRDLEGKDDFYIIDPNTRNVHDSPNLDYAKLLQSIHGGYEFLMVTKNVEIAKNSINFIFTKSEAYMYLWHMLDTYLSRNFAPERVMSIYYHEIIHWLRLMPYKIEKNGKRVLLFYAGMLLVMNDVVEKFEKE